MSRRVKTHAVLLNTLAHCSPTQRKLILKTADKGLVDAICECVVNLVRGNIKLSPAQKKTFAKQKRYLRKLADRKTALKTRKNILVQRGGFFLPLLSRLIGPVIGAIGSLVGGRK